jgi:beta-lactamase regulating signal transducer with metallopeptidase domain
MGTCLQIGLTNALWAAVLAIFVSAVTRIWRNPHLAHALWLIVLLRLVAPPVFQLPLQTPAWLTRATPTNAPDAMSATPDLERSDSKSARGRVVKTGDDALPTSVFPKKALGPVGPLLKSASTCQASTTNPSNVPSSDAPTPVLRSLSPVDIGGGLWVFGTVLYLTVTITRVRRFGRAIGRFRSPAPAWLADEIAELSRIVGLRRVPRLAVVEAALPPMVWSGWRPTLLVPKTIVDSLDSSQRRMLLLHELWHVRRGDHWTRWFAVVVLALYWWNPAAWWAVRRLQNAEEECCDAAVLSLDPQPETYGEALLAVSEFVWCGSLPAAAVSIGIERKNHLKRRMTMILKGSRWPRLSKGRLAVVAACGAVAIGVSLTTAIAQVESTGPTSTGQTNANPDKTAMNAALRQHYLGKISTPNMQTASQSPGAASAKVVVPARSGNASPPSTQALPPPLTQDQVLKLLPSDSETQRMLKERYNAAVRALQLSRYQYEVGQAGVTFLISAERSLLEARLALALTREEEIRARQDYLDFITSCWKEAKARLDIGGAAGFNPVEEAQAREAMYDAKLKLAQVLPAKSAKGSDTPRRGSSADSLSPGAEPLPSKQPPTAAASGQEPLPALLTAKGLEPEAGDSELGQAMKARYNSALKSLQGSYFRTTFDPNNRLTIVVTAARTLLDAELAITAPKEMAAVYQRYFEFWKYLDGITEKRWNQKTIGADEFNAVHEARLDAEIKLMQARSASSNPRTETKAGSISQVVLQSLETRVRIGEAEVIGSQAAVVQSKAELKRALANLTYRQLQFDRLQALRKHNGVGQDAVDEATRARDDAAASVDVVKASIEAAQAQVAVKEAQLKQARLELDQVKATGNQ